MSLATLEGVTVTRANVQVPAWGLWWAGVDLDDDRTLSGRVTLQLADVSLSGTIVSGGTHNGRAYYRIVGGAGGWGREVPAKSYNDDAGVRVSTLLTDLARAAGEQVTDIPSTRVGPHFARSKAGAYLTLNGLAPRNWHVDFAGVTRIGLRPTAAFAGSEPRTRVDPAGSIVEIAAERIASLVPGVTIDGSQPATDVEYELDSTRLTVRVYAGRTLARRLAAYAKLLEGLDPWRRYRGVFEFRVVTQSGHRLNLQPVRVASEMPDLANVPVRPGASGLRATVALGERVLVSFIDGDPSRPCVTSHEEPGSPGWNPQLIELGEATDYVAQAGKVATELQRLRTWSDAHTHPTGIGPSGPPTAPTQSHESTACTKVRVQ